MTTPSTGPYPQPPYGQPPQPPKKRTGLIVLLVILAVMLIGIVGCAALIGTAGKAITEGTTGACSHSKPRTTKIRLPSPRRNAMRILMRSCAGSLGFSTVLILGSGGH